MSWINKLPLFLLIVLMTAGCFRYSFTGIAIPADVRTVYIPFFSDQSGSGLGDLSDQLNEALINRFVNQSRLRLSSDPNEADVILDGTIIGYNNRPYTVGGDERAGLYEVQVTVRASFRYTREEEPEWENKSFQGNFQYDADADPIEGENEAALGALNRIADNIFNDALGDW